MFGELKDMCPIFGCRTLDPDLKIQVAHFEDGSPKIMEIFFADSIFEYMAETFGSEKKTIHWVNGKTWAFSVPGKIPKKISDFKATTPEELAVKMSLAGFTL